MTKNFGVGQGPVTPSRLKIGDYQISAVETAQPTDRVKGLDVSKWRRVVFAVHPVSPDINDAAAIGWRLNIKIWRWKMLARQGTARPAGQWFAEEEVVVSMDGDVAAGGPMEYEIPTWDAEQIYLQPVLSTGPVAWTAMVTLFGLVPRITEDGGSCECEAGSTGTASNGAALIVQSMFDLIAHENYTYSNLRGDFDAIRSGATTIDLTNVRFPLEERQILAVGLKLTGAVTPTRIWYRDKNLRCDFNPATGRITISGFTIQAADSVCVWLEGPSKIDDMEINARRVKAMNPDSKHVTLDGNLFLQMAALAAVEYIPLNMGEDGLHWLSLHHNCTGDVTVTIEGTDDLARDGSERWDDITQQLTGYTQIDAVTPPDVLPPMSWCGWRRIRFVCSPGAAGGVVDIFFMRSAYGAAWNPQAYDGGPVEPAGPQIMGEARGAQAAALAQGQAGRLVANLYKELVLASHDWNLAADRIKEIDPYDQRDVVERIINVTNLADGVAHYVYIDGDHLEHFSLQTVLSDGTATDDIRVWIHASNEPQANPAAVTYWADVGLDIFGTAFVDNTVAAVNRMDWLDTHVGARWFRLTYQRIAGVANDGDVYAYLKRWW